MERALEIALAADSPVASSDRQQPRRLRDVRGRLSTHGRALRRGDATRRALRRRVERPLHPRQPHLGSTSCSGAGTARSSRRTRSSPSARRDRRTRRRCSCAKCAGRSRLARGDRDACRSRPAARARARAGEARRRSTSLGALADHAQRCTAELGRAGRRARRSRCSVSPIVREIGLHGALTRLAPLADELGIGDDLREAVAVRAWADVPVLAQRDRAHPRGRADSARRPHGVGGEPDDRGEPPQARRPPDAGRRATRPRRRSSSSVRSRSIARSTRRPTSPRSRARSPALRASRRR